MESKKEGGFPLVSPFISGNWPRETENKNKKRGESLSGLDKALTFSSLNCKSK